MQINIQQIENGFLVATPPGRLVQEQMMKQGLEPKAVVEFGKDYDEVCAILRNKWPVALTIIK